MRPQPALRVVTTGNIIPLRPALPLPAPQRRVRSGGPLLAAIAVSVVLHAAVLVAVHAPRMAPPPAPPTPLDVVLVEPPKVAAPVAAPQPVAPAPQAEPARDSTTQRRSATPPKRTAVPHRSHPVERAQALPQQKAAPHPEPRAPQAVVPRAPAVPPAAPAPLSIPAAEPPQAVLPMPPANTGPSEPPSTARSAARADVPGRSGADQASSSRPGAGGPGPTSAPSFNAAYLHNPAPAYPLIARRNGQQGTVTLEVVVTREGLAGEVAVHTSSGFPALDAAALATVKQWRFVPAQQGGRAVQAAVLVPIVFRLRDAS